MKREILKLSSFGLDQARHRVRLPTLLPFTEQWNNLPRSSRGSGALRIALWTSNETKPIYISDVSPCITSIGMCYRWKRSPFYIPPSKTYTWYLTQAVQVCRNTVHRLEMTARVSSTAIAVRDLNTLETLPQGHTCCQR